MKTNTIVAMNSNIRSLMNVLDDLINDNIIVINTSGMIFKVEGNHICYLRLPYINMKPMYNDAYRVFMSLSNKNGNVSFLQLLLDQMTSSEVISAIDTYVMRNCNNPDKFVDKYILEDICDTSDGTDNCIYIDTPHGIYRIYKTENNEISFSKYISNGKAYTRYNMDNVDKKVFNKEYTGNIGLILSKIMKHNDISADFTLSLFRNSLRKYESYNECIEYTKNQLVDYDE